MQTDDCFRLGHIVKKHGLKGEVSILLDVDYPEDYIELESVFVEVNKQLVPFFVERFQLNGNRGIVKFEEVDSLESAEELLKCDLYLPMDVLPELDGEGQFYYHEVIGYKVVDKESGELGAINQIYEFPNQDMLGVQFKEKEVLVPITDDIVKTVDREKNELHVILPAGLLDVYLED